MDVAAAGSRAFDQAARGQTGRRFGGSSGALRAGVLGDALPTPALVRAWQKACRNPRDETDPPCPGWPRLSRDYALAALARMEVAS